MGYEERGGMSLLSILMIDSISKVYYDEELEKKIVALYNISMEIKEGEFLCLIGPSGSGKSTLLNMIAGFFPPTTGSILLHGERITSPGPDRGVVFQEYTLFPWLTILQNVEFGLKNIKIPFIERRERALYYLEQVGLEEFVHARPYELSGGMKQRVAIARVLALNPSILLMDEPFGALDAQTRQMLQEEVLNIWEREKKTVIFVTHNVDEAIFLGDRVVVLTKRPGEIKRDMELDLLRPRDRYSERLSSLKKELLEDLTNEAFLDHGRRDDGWKFFRGEEE